MKVLAIVGAVVALLVLTIMAVRANNNRKEARRIERQEKYWAEMCREIMDEPELPLDWRKTM